MGVPHTCLAATVYIFFFPFQGIAKLALVIEWVVQVYVPSNIRIGQGDRKVSEWNDSKTLRTWNT